MQKRNDLDEFVCIRAERRVYGHAIITPYSLTLRRKGKRNNISATVTTCRSQLHALAALLPRETVPSYPFDRLQTGLVAIQ
jgi:hypothetical protein